jgi:hypothetical protein
MTTQITSESIAGLNVTISPDGTTNAVFNSATFDAVLGPTPGAVAVRGPVSWTMLPPGTAGSVLQTNGPNVPPSWVANNSTLNSAAVDAAFGSGVGSMLYRGAGGWTTLSLSATANSLITNSGGAPTWQTLSTLMDNALSGTQGSVAYRNASGWVALAPGTSGQLLSSGGAGANPSWVNPAGTGTVTSVALSLPAIFSVTGSPVTTAGTLTATLANQSANLVFAGPASGGPGAPSFRALTTADYGVLQVSKNYLLNGAMMVNQRYPSGTLYTGSTVGVTAAFPVDMFTINFSFDGTLTAQQIAQATPGGSPARLKVLIGTADTAIASTQYVALVTKIEGSRVADLQWGTANAKTVTLDFGCNLPSGTYGIGVQNAAQNRSYVTTFSISAPEAGTDVRRSVVIPGDTAGTWPKDNSTGMLVFLGLSAGSVYQTTAGAWGAGAFFATSLQSNFAGTAGNVAHFFDVGLYAASAPPSTFQVPDFVSELAACERYYEKSYNLNVTPGTASEFSGSFGFFIAGLSGSTAIGAVVDFRQQKRISPTVTPYSTNTGSSGVIYDANGGLDRIPAQLDDIGDRCFRAGIATASTGGQSFYLHYTADASM